MEKQINISINDGRTFFSNEISVNFNPAHFTLDFKCIAPRVDHRSKSGPTFLIEHNPVLIEPYHLKQFLGLLSDVVKRYEKEFGKITASKAIRQSLKKSKTKKSSKPTIPNYFG